MQNVNNNFNSSVKFRYYLTFNNKQVKFVMFSVMLRCWAKSIFYQRDFNIHLYINLIMSFELWVDNTLKYAFSYEKTFKLLKIKCVLFCDLTSGNSLNGKFFQKRHIHMHDSTIQKLYKTHLFFWFKSTRTILGYSECRIVFM